MRICQEVGVKSCLGELGRLNGIWSWCSPEIHSSPDLFVSARHGRHEPSHRTVDRGYKIGTGGLWLCQLGFARRTLVLACLGRGLALTNKPVLDCRSVFGIIEGGWEVLVCNCRCRNKCRDKSQRLLHPFPNLHSELLLKRQPAGWKGSRSSLIGQSRRFVRKDWSFLQSSGMGMERLPSRLFHCTIPYLPKFAFWAAD